MLSLLEPEPDKRPSVRAAMEDKWINEGYAKKPLHTLSYKNRWRSSSLILKQPPDQAHHKLLLLCLFRLRPEDLNASVLTYMTEALNYTKLEITNTVTANRPSTIMASYHLLLHKLSRSHRGTKAAKVCASSSHTLTDSHIAFFCFESQKYKCWNSLKFCVSGRNQRATTVAVQTR